LAGKSHGAGLPVSGWLLLHMVYLNVTSKSHARRTREQRGDIIIIFSVLLANARFAAVGLHALGILPRSHYIMYQPAALNLLQDVLHDYVHAAIGDWIVSQLFLDGIYTDLSVPLLSKELKRLELLYQITDDSRFYKK
jgi:hypothetical protein